MSKINKIICKNGININGRKPEIKGKTIVAVLPDTGLRYLSTNLFNEEYQV